MEMIVLYTAIALAASVSAASAVIALFVLQRLADGVEAILARAHASDAPPVLDAVLEECEPEPPVEPAAVVKVKRRGKRIDLGLGERMFAEGALQKDVGEALGVSPGTAAKIQAGTHWQQREREAARESEM